MIDQVILTRLVRFYDPVAVLESTFGLRGALRSSVTTGVFEHPARADYVEGEARTREWHLGRVRYFVECLRNGVALEPVDVDNRCYGYAIAEPIIVDGHHRAVAHLITRKRRIPVAYSGRVDTLNYLTGKKRYPPLDLRS